MLFNKASDKKIIQNVTFARTHFERFKGLMFEKEQNFNYALIFELPEKSLIGSSVHMMFVFFPIDIVFLDEQKKVVDKKTLSPWTLNYTPKKAAKYFIELPAQRGEIVKLGDKLDWD